MNYKIKKKCLYDNWDIDKPCPNIAVYECIVCGTGVCKKHEKSLCGECPNCEPPYLIKIRKTK
jgi:hypothetical protein